MDQIGNSAAIKLEKLHVHSVYEEIAEHFSETRHKPWPKVMDFLDSKLTHPGAILGPSHLLSRVMGFLRSRFF